MPSLSNQGPRPLATTTLTALAATTAIGASPQGIGRPGSAPSPYAQGSGRVEVADRDSSVRLSARALSDGAASGMASDTMALARQFMQPMAEALFGSAAKGASFDFHAIGLQSSASVSASAAVDAGYGVRSSASLSVTESAHFVGTGQLMLADGNTYEVDVEVNYAASASTAETQPATPDMILTGKQLPAIRYPGGIEDLFKLLGRELASEGGDPGKLTLRLMRLVDRAALLAPRLPAEDATAAARQLAANAYASAGAVEAGA